MTTHFEQSIVLAGGVASAVGHVEQGRGAVIALHVIAR